MKHIDKELILSDINTILSMFSIFHSNIPCYNASTILVGLPNTNVEVRQKDIDDISSWFGPLLNVVVTTNDLQSRMSETALRQIAEGLISNHTRYTDLSKEDFSEYVNRMFATRRFVLRVEEVRPPTIRDHVAKRKRKRKPKCETPK